MDQSQPYPCIDEAVLFLQDFVLEVCLLFQRLRERLLDFSMQPWERLLDFSADSLGSESQLVGSESQLVAWWASNIAWWASLAICVCTAEKMAMMPALVTWCPPANWTSQAPAGPAHLQTCPRTRFVAPLPLSAHCELLVPL